MNSFLLQIEEENVQRLEKVAVSACFKFYRERECLISRFPVVWTFGSLRAKK